MATPIEIKKKKQKELETAKAASPKDRLELAQARAPGQTVTMEKGVINTQTPDELAVANAREKERIAALIKTELKPAATPEQIEAAKMTGKPMPEDIQAVLNQQAGIIPKPSETNKGQAIAAGFKVAAPGAVTGAAAGLLGSAGIASIPLAAVGAGIGFYKGYVDNLKKQRREDIAKSTIGIRKRTANMQAYTGDINQGGDWVEDDKRFNMEMAALDKEYTQLKLDIQNDFLGEDGTAEMEAFEIFNEPGGTREKLINDQKQALLNPDPTKVLASLDTFEPE